MRRRWWGISVGGVFLLLSRDVSTHPSAIEDIEETQEPFAIALGVDALEPAVGFDLHIGEREASSHAGYRPAAVQVCKGTPHPKEVGRKGWLIIKSLSLDAFFFLDLAQPPRDFRRGALRPVEVA
jgi:hypothetical protein